MYAELFFFIAGVFVATYALLGRLPKRLNVSRTNPTAIRAMIAGVGIILVGLGIFNNLSSSEPSRNMTAAATPATSFPQPQQTPQTSPQAPTSPQTAATMPSGSSPQLAPKSVENIQGHNVPNIQAVPRTVTVRTLPDSIVQRAVRRAQEQQRMAKGL